MQPILLSPLVYQLAGFGPVSTLSMLLHLFNYYEAIDEIDLEEKTVKMMGPHDPEESLARLIEQLKKEYNLLVKEGGQLPTR